MSRTILFEFDFYWYLMKFIKYLINQYHIFDLGFDLKESSQNRSPNDSHLSSGLLRGDHGASFLLLDGHTLALFGL